eukprot:Lankesteria_metandrocarpae@DN5218_c1_g1_i2.p1
MKCRLRNPHLRNLSTFLDTMSPQFDERELSYIRERTGVCSSSTGMTNEGEQLRRFMECWTAKESYLKAIGTGLYINPRDVHLHGLGSDTLSLSVEDKRLASFSVQLLTLHGDLPPDSQVVASVCAGPLSDAELVYREKVAECSRGATGRSGASAVQRMHVEVKYISFKEIYNRTVAHV